MDDLFEAIKSNDLVAVRKYFAENKHNRFYGLLWLILGSHYLEMMNHIT